MKKFMVKRTAMEAGLPEDPYYTIMIHKPEDPQQQQQIEEAAIAFWSGLESTVAGAYAQNFEHFAVLRSA